MSHAGTDVNHCMNKKKMKFDSCGINVNQCMEKKLNLAIVDALKTSDKN